MNNASKATNDPVVQWRNHISQAAKAFLQCAVVIDDMPFRRIGRMVTNGYSPSENGENDPMRAAGEVSGPLPGSAKVARMSARKVPVGPASETTNNREFSADQQGQLPSESNGSPHELNLKVLTDSFASEDIVCGTLIPDCSDFKVSTEEDAELDLVLRAMRMGQMADILILDWFLKDRSSETTLEIIHTVLTNDKQQGGRTRLICIYTGEDKLEEISEQVSDQLSGYHFSLQVSNDSITLRNDSTVFVFFNKKGVGGKYSISENLLAGRLVSEFARLIDGVLPSFVASSIGAIRRNTHGILDVFRAGLDAAYVGNRAICSATTRMRRARQSR